MTGTIRPTRSYVDRSFSVLGFTVHTGMSRAWFEVALATDARLLHPEFKEGRTERNFYSTHASGPLEAIGGESVYLVPPHVLSRFAGQDRLYYAVATFTSSDRRDPQVTLAAPEVTPYITISRSYNGQMLRQMIGVPNPRGGLSGETYGVAQAGQLTWAGDEVAPGTMTPLSPSANGKAAGPAANGKSGNSAVGSATKLAVTPAEPPEPSKAQGYDIPYDDGFSQDFWAQSQEAADSSAQDDGPGIEGPIPAEADASPGSETTAQSLALSAPQYPQASRFVPAATGNFRSSTGPRTISRIVIHITDGVRKNGVWYHPTMNGTVGWFQNPSSGVSAHYIVGQDGEVVQMVAHDDVAYHAHTANGDSIGIEHVADPHGLPPTDEQYCASAALVNWLCQQWGVPMDRDHILGHSEADPRTSHTDCPNSVWDWAYFMDMVTSASCYPRPAASAQSQAFRHPASNGRPAQVGPRQGYNGTSNGTSGRHGNHRQAGAHPMSRMAPSPHPSSAARSAALGEGQSFDINWSDVELVGQPDGMSCWAASGAMLVGWRDRVSIDPQEVARGGGHWAEYVNQNGLLADNFADFARAWRLIAEPPQDYSVDRFYQLLQTVGPLWVGIAVPSGHAVVVTGIYGDGTPDGTFVRINDPWPPGHGTVSTLSYQQFAQEYDNFANANSAGDVNVQILHAEGTDGRTVSQAQGEMSPLAYRRNNGSGRKTSPPNPARVRPLSGEQSFDLNWDDVPLINQTRDNSCWAASASMVCSWRDRQTENFNDATAPPSVTDYARFFNLVAEPLQSYSIPAFRQMLEANGPLWLSEAVPQDDPSFDPRHPGYHAIVVTGLYGDGAPDGSDTYVRINDPWDRDPGTPGNPGPYLNTHDHGSQYVLTWQQLIREYEAVPTNPNLDGGMQIMHAADTDGRSPGRGQSLSLGQGASPVKRSTSRAAQAMVAAAPVVVPIASAIAGAAMMRILSNEGDIRWELDQLQGLKHPFNDAANAGNTVYTNTTTVVNGPWVENLASDRITADFEVQWDHNGRSLGNIGITNTHTNDALGWGLEIKANILDDANSYTTPGGSETFAAVKVRFYFRFTRSIGSDVIAIVDFKLYGNGTYDELSRWTQE